MKKIIILGANGFIGRELTHKFVEHSIQVVAVDVNPDIMSLADGNKIIAVCACLENVDNLVRKIPNGSYDALINLAWRGVNGNEKADPLVQIDNIKAALNAAMLAKQLGVQKLLTAGTIAEMSIYSLPKLKVVPGGMMYASAKNSAHMMLETYCKANGISHVWMRFSNIYGPQNKTGNILSYTVEALKKNKEATFGPANQPYDFIYIDDLVEAVYRIAICDTKCEEYFIGSGSPRFLKEYLFEVGELFGKRELIGIGKREDDHIHYDMEMFDNQQLLRDIGDYVNCSFAEGLKRTIEFY